MKYPVGTLIKSKSSPDLKGLIISKRGKENTVLWSDGVRDDWQNLWFDVNFETDSDKVLTIPYQLDEDLFEI